MKFCCGITTYNPSEEDEFNIVSYAKVFDKIYIYDNSDERPFSKTYSTLCDVISKGRNDGLGVSLDCLCKKAKQDNFDYIMLFDQDSRISTEDLIKLIDNAKDNPGNIGIYCPQIIYGYETGKTSGTEFVDWCITSGSMILLSMYGTSVVYDSKYFIDRLDRDFCKQVHNSNYNICRINDIRLFQQLGESRKMAGKIRTTHQPLRHYYMSRNRWYYNDKFRVGTCVSLLQTIKHCYLIMRFEPLKQKKIKMVFSGIKDFMKGRMGAWHGES